MVRLAVALALTLTIVGCAELAPPETTPSPETAAPDRPASRPGEHAKPPAKEAPAGETPGERGEGAKPPPPPDEQPPPPYPAPFFPPPAPTPEPTPAPAPHPSPPPGAGPIGEGQNPPGSEETPSPAPEPPSTPKPPGGATGETAVVPSPSAGSALPGPILLGFLGVGVLLCILIAVAAMFVANPSGFQYMVFRTILALGAACVAAAIGGAVVQPAGTPSTASMFGGGVGVFLTVYLLDPVTRLGKKAGRRESGSLPAGATEESIFISYRHGDVVEVADRLHDKLVERYGDPAVFKDVEDIGLGTDYRVALAEALRRCKVVIAVIGPEWETIADENGTRKLDVPSDPLRVEIATALERNIALIPALVHRTAMPKAERLPPEIQQVVFRNFIVIRPDPDFANDVDRLVRAIDRCVAGG